MKPLKDHTILELFAVVEEVNKRIPARPEYPYPATHQSDDEYWDKMRDFNEASDLWGDNNKKLFALKDACLAVIDEKIDSLTEEVYLEEGEDAA